MSQKNNNNNRSSSPHRNRSNSPNKNPDPLQLFSGTNGSRKANSPQRKSSLGKIINALKVLCTYHFR